MSYGSDPYAPPPGWTNRPEIGQAGPPISGLAVASLVCGIVSSIMGAGGWMCCLSLPGANLVVGPVSMIVGLVAGVLGYWGMNECRAGRKSGHGLALAGMITSLMGVLVSGVGLLLVLGIFAAVISIPT